MFSTLQGIPYINQKIFLNNAGYQWIGFSEERITAEQSYRVIQANIAHMEPKNGGIHLKRSYPLELFVQGGNGKSAFSETFFVQKNLYQGNLEDLSGRSNSIDIALSFNAVKRLKAFLGDTVTIYMDSNGELIVYPATIKAILRTKYPDHHIGFGGLGLIGSDSNFEDFLQENNIPYQYVMFGSGSTDIFQFDRKIYKKDQLAAASLLAISMPGSSNLGLYVLAAMGILAIYIIISRELNFSANKRMRNIGIMRALGTPHNVIKTIFLVEQAIKIVFASLGAAIVYKYLLFERFLGDYIDVKVLILMLLFFIAIGMVNLAVAMRKITRILSDHSVFDIITQKEF
jgi:hypothetical protein